MNLIWKEGIRVPSSTPAAVYASLNLMYRALTEMGLTRRSLREVTSGARRGILPALKTSRDACIATLVDIDAAVRTRKGGDSKKRPP